MEFRKTMLSIIFLIGLLLVLNTLLNRHVSDFEKNIEKELFDNPALRNLNLSKQEKMMMLMLVKYMDKLSPENLLKWSTVHPGPYTYNFKTADQYLEFCRKMHVPVIGESFLGHRQIPDWVFQDKNGNPVDRDTLLQRMQEHILTVVGRYKGRIRGWDVVNRAIAQDGQLYQNRWLQIIGPDYIEKAFEFARQADSTAELYYTDVFIEKPQKRQGVIRLIRSLQANGVHVHAIGIQGRWGLDDPPIKEIENNIVELSALCGKVMIIDLDITSHAPTEQENDTIPSHSFLMQKLLDGYSEEQSFVNQQQFSLRYTELFQLFRKHRDKISHVTFWGVPIFQSWQDLIIPTNQLEVAIDE